MKQNYPTSTTVVLLVALILASGCCGDGGGGGRPQANRPPTVSISSPTDGAEFPAGGTVRFEGTASDPEDGVLSGDSLVWNSSLDGELGTGEACTRDDLSVGLHTITLTATDSEGASAADSISVLVKLPNQVPRVAIIAPPDGATYFIGTAVQFLGSGSDPEDGILTGDSLVWTSSLDGELGIGEACTRYDLAVGVHTITLTATDSGDASASDSITVQITVPNQPPAVTITSPIDSYWCYVGQAVTFRGNATDPEDGVLTGGSLVWTSNVDGDFGTGEVCTRDDLTPEEHTITLTATDSNGVSASDSILIQIAPYTSDVYLLKTDSSGNVEWEKAFGSYFGDWAHSVQQTSDGGCIIAGETYGLRPWDFSDVYLLRTDSYGNLEWEKTFGDTGDDRGYSVQQTSDGGYIVAGKMVSTDYSGDDAYLIKTDSAGELEWERTFGPFHTEARSVQQTTDGGYVVAGTTFAPASSLVYLAKTDPSGNLEWEKWFGDPVEGDSGRSVRQTLDGGYVVAGTAWDDAGTHSAVRLLKTSSSGDLVWENTFGSGDHAYGNSVRQTGDGGYIVAGTITGGGGLADVYLVRADASGNLEWEKTFGGARSDEGHCAVPAADGGYVVTGNTCSFVNAYPGNAYLVKTDSNGDMEWERVFTGPEMHPYCGYSIQQTDDAGYIIAGEVKYSLSLPGDSLHAKGNHVAQAGATRDSSGAGTLWSHQE